MRFWRWIASKAFNRGFRSGYNYGRTSVETSLIHEYGVLKDVPARVRKVLKSVVEE